MRYSRAGYDAPLKFNHVLYINLQLNMTSFRVSGECLTYIFTYQNRTLLFCIENEINRKNCFHKEWARIGARRPPDGGKMPMPKCSPKHIKSPPLNTFFNNLHQYEKK